MQTLIFFLIVMGCGCLFAAASLALCPGGLR